MLELSNIKKVYTGGKVAVDNVSLTLEPGQIVGLFGGIQKIYVNNTLAGSAYKAENRYFDVPADTSTMWTCSRRPRIPGSRGNIWRSWTASPSG